MTNRPKYETAYSEDLQCECIVKDDVHVYTDFPHIASLLNSQDKRIKELVEALEDISTHLRIGIIQYEQDEIDDYYFRDIARGCRSVAQALIEKYKKGDGE